MFTVRMLDIVSEKIESAVQNPLDYSCANRSGAVMTVPGLVCYQ